MSEATTTTAPHDARYDELDDATLIAHVSRLLFEGAVIAPGCPTCAELLRRLYLARPS